MILPDLINLINAYNENGIYFLYDSILWWFNGKRFEKWRYCYNISKIFIYNNKLYARAVNNGSQNYILENQQFKLIPEIFPNCSCLDDNNVVYSYERHHLFRNGKRLPNKMNDAYGFKLLHHEGFLYFFSSLMNGINEKFNIETNEWTFISNQIIYTISDMCLLNNIFYILFDNGMIGTYNSKSDTWHLLNLSLSNNHHQRKI